MKFFSMVFAIIILIAGNVVANNIVDTNPTNGTTFVNGKEVRYYVSADKKFLNMDSKSELMVCQYRTTNTKPDGFTGSFNYEDKYGVTRSCHYKTLTTISKNNMIPA